MGDIVGSGYQDEPRIWPAHSRDCSLGSGASQTSNQHVHCGCYVVKCQCVTSICFYWLLFFFSFLSQPFPPSPAPRHSMRRSVPGRNGIQFTCDEYMTTSTRTFGCGVMQRECRHECHVTLFAFSPTTASSRLVSPLSLSSHCFCPPVTVPIPIPFPLPSPFHSNNVVVVY